MAVLTVDASHLPVPLTSPMRMQGFKVIFSCVKSPHFDASWIGRELDEVFLFQTSSAYRLGATIHAEMHGAATAHMLQIS